MPSPVDELVSEWNAAEAAALAPLGLVERAPGYYAIDLEGPAGWAGVVSARKRTDRPGIARLAYPGCMITHLPTERLINLWRGTPDADIAATLLLYPWYAQRWTGYAVVAGVSVADPADIAAAVAPTVALVTEVFLPIIREWADLAKVQDYFAHAGRRVGAESTWLEHQAVWAYQRGAGDRLPGLRDEYVAAVTSLSDPATLAFLARLDARGEPPR